MKQKNPNAAGENSGNSGAVNLTIILVSIAALLATFLLGFIDLGFAAELIIFILILIVFLAVCATVYFRRAKSQAEDSLESSAQFDREIENRLQALEDASLFFGASLKPADMFRLIASRVNELIPCAACVLFCEVENQNKLKIEYAAGRNAVELKNIEIVSNKSVAGKAFVSRQIELDKNLSPEKSGLPPAISADFQFAAAVPLFRANDVFAVFQLYFDNEKQFDDRVRLLLEAVGERIAPLMAGSMSFENSLANALTDALTNLPNQRAFFLVLENQIAESARYQSDRALSMLAIDIKNFDELNRQFGHATADRILAFAGENIKLHLRQMDFLARSGGDEFLAVLPTAAENVAVEIIERLERTFDEKHFDVNEQEKVFVKLNFGMATFGADGETAPQLLKIAVMRKQQSKSGEPGKILWFPKEFAD